MQSFSKKKKKVIYYHLHKTKNVLETLRNMPHNVDLWWWWSTLYIVWETFFYINRGEFITILIHHHITILLRSISIKKLSLLNLPRTVFHFFSLILFRCKLEQSWQQLNCCHCFLFSYGHKFTGTLQKACQLDFLSVLLEQYIPVVNLNT